MKGFNTFYIHKTLYDLKEGAIYFHYSFDKMQYFKETIVLDHEHAFRRDMDENTIENILFHISIAFGISYYKLYPTKEIIIDSGYLNSDQQGYWKDFYIQGLGEFFYTNNIDFSTFCNFTSTGGTPVEFCDFSLSNNYILPIGGGKDSIVSSILLEEENTLATPFIFGKIDPIKRDFLDIYGKKVLNIQRQLDTKLFEMNSQGYYNGHVPITGLISFFLIFVCYVYDYKYIVFSNEKSANIGNIKINTLEINHQYSKSGDFEEKLSQYIHLYISKSISYTSRLRNYYEIEIAEIFAKKGKKYLNIFSSCNKNFTITKTITERWCNNCPKCLFVYIILRPYLTPDETLEIFGEELFQRKDLKNLFSEIIGISGIKPFECVGEVEEAQLGCYMSISNFNKELPFLLKYFKEHFLNNHEDKYFLKLRKKYNV